MGDTVLSLVIEDSAAYYALILERVLIILLYAAAVNHLEIKLHSRDKFTQAAAMCISSVVISGGVSLLINQKVYQNFGKSRSGIAI